MNLIWVGWWFVALSCLRLLRAQTESMFQNVSVPKNGSVEAVVSRIPADVTFIILQFHTQNHNATVSYTRALAYGKFITAVDPGLLFSLLPAQTSLFCFLMAPEGEAVAGTGVLLPYTSIDPVPGACNLEFPLEIDPNIYISYNIYETIIRFAPANIGSERGIAPPACDVQTGVSDRWRLVYDLYQYFLPENDLSVQSLISSMQRVATVPGMIENGKKLMTLSSRDRTEVSFNSIPGQGVIYSVIVRDPLYNSSASYVPVHTYACNFTSVIDSCSSLGRVFTKVFFTFIGVAGLFVCFLGHRFFKSELFCMGFSFTAFFFFVLITKTTTLDYDIQLALTVLIGNVGGVALVMIWWRFGSVLLCVLVVGFNLGFLMSSVIFFTPLGDLTLFRNEILFWMLFSAFVLVVMLFFVARSKESNIVACGVVGAYAVVLAVSVYTYTSLSYITLDVLKRIVNNYFSRAFISVPMQLTDFILIALWVTLAVMGITVQLYRERSRPFFPPSPYVLWCQERERRKTNVLDPSYHTPSLPTRLLTRFRQLVQHREPAGERTPLLL